MKKHIPAILKMAFALVLFFAMAQNAKATSFTLNQLITIPDSPNLFDNLAGPANPFPSTISVSFPDIVTDVNVKLNGLTHGIPDDLDILLVGPTGVKVLLMSDAGGTFNGLDNEGLSLVNLKFDDAASSFLPDESQIVAGRFKPTNYGGGDVFPSPAPGGPYGSALSAFNGQNPNGSWNLFILDDDDTPMDSLEFLGQGFGLGWRLDINQVPEPSAFILLGSGLLGLAPVMRKRDRSI